MKVTLRGKDYEFELHGTVGLRLMTEMQLGVGEPFDFTNPKHMLLMYYNAFCDSNKEFMPFDDFVMALTSKELAKVAEHFNQRWTELEGPSPEEEDSDKKKV